MRLPCVALALLAIPTSAVAAPISSVPADVDGRAVQAITWTDASGMPRTVSVLADDLAIIRYVYDVDGTTVTDDAVADYGIGQMVNHGDCGASTTFAGTSEHEATEVLAGDNHYIWRSTFRHPMCNNPGVSWRVTSEYVFYTGHDHFIQTVTYDSSDLAMDQPLGDDMRGPYNQTTWPGNGDISGFGWGSQYRFATTGPIADGDANVGGGVAVTWEWTEPNTIPYVWEWCDLAAGAAVDREYGIVQNQPYAEQDFGGGFYDCGGDCFAGTPPLSGNALPAAWAMPSQMSSYDSNYRSGRITWGQTYGTMENHHANDTQTIPDMGDRFRPIDAWSWTHVVGAYSDGGVMARVADTEHAYASSLAATTGTVVTSGPRGPGDFVGPTVGEMPTIDWSNPGFDFIYRTWNVTAADGAAAVTLTVTGGLVRPVLVVHEFGDGEPVVRIDGADAVLDSDAFVSRDAATGKLWVTLARDLDAGMHTIVVASEGGPIPPDDTGGGGGDGTGAADGTGGVGSAGGTAGAGEGEGTGAGGGDASGGGSSAAADDAGSSGCGCNGAARTAPWWALVLLAVRRRRR